MKTISTRIQEHLHRDNGELIARFGQAELVRHLNGRCKLRGGTAVDHARAKEWCSLFFHEVSIVWPLVSAAPAHPCGVTVSLNGSHP